MENNAWHQRDVALYVKEIWLTLATGDAKIKITESEWFKIILELIFSTQEESMEVKG